MFLLSVNIWLYKTEYIVLYFVWLVKALFSSSAGDGSIDLQEYEHYMTGVRKCSYYIKLYMLHVRVAAISRLLIPCSS